MIKEQKHTKYLFWDVFNTEKQTYQIFVLSTKLRYVIKE